MNTLIITFADTIAAIGNIGDAHAKNIIDAKGMAVAPGGGVTAGAPVPAGMGVAWPRAASGVATAAPVIFQPATKLRTVEKTR